MGIRFALAQEKGSGAVSGQSADLRYPTAVWLRRMASSSPLDDVAYGSSGAAPEAKFVCTAVPINPTETLPENLNENMVAFLRSLCT